MNSFMQKLASAIRSSLLKPISVVLMTLWAITMAVETLAFVVSLDLVWIDPVAVSIHNTVGAWFWAAWLVAVPLSGLICAAQLVLADQIMPRLIKWIFPTYAY